MPHKRQMLHMKYRRKYAEPTNNLVSFPKTESVVIQDNQINITACLSFAIQRCHSIKFFRNELGEIGKFAKSC